MQLKKKKKKKDYCPLHYFYFKTVLHDEHQSFTELYYAINTMCWKLLTTVKCFSLFKKTWF